MDMGLALDPRNAGVDECSTVNDRLGLPVTSLLGVGFKRQERKALRKKSRNIFSPQHLTEAQRQQQESP